MAAYHALRKQLLQAGASEDDCDEIQDIVLDVMEQNEVGFEPSTADED